MSETELQNLVINKLTQEQYDELVAQDLVNENEIYLTPEGGSSEGCTIEQARASLVATPIADQDTKQMLRNIIDGPYQKSKIIQCSLNPNTAIPAINTTICTNSHYNSDNNLYHIFSIHSHNQIVELFWKGKNMWGPWDPVTGTVFDVVEYWSGSDPYLKLDISDTTWTLSGSLLSEPVSVEVQKDSNNHYPTYNVYIRITRSGEIVLRVNEAEVTGTCTFFTGGGTSYSWRLTNTGFADLEYYPKESGSSTWSNQITTKPDEPLLTMINYYEWEGMKIAVDTTIEELQKYGVQNMFVFNRDTEEAYLPLCNMYTSLWADKESIAEWVFPSPDEMGHFHYESLSTVASGERINITKTGYLVAQTNRYGGNVHGYIELTYSSDPGMLVPCSKDKILSTEPAGQLSVCLPVVAGTSVRIAYDITSEFGEGATLELGIILVGEK